MLIDDKTAWVKLMTRNARDLRAIIQAGIILRLQTGATITEDVQMQLYVDRDLMAGELDERGMFELARPPKLEHGG